MDIADTDINTVDRRESEVDKSQFEKESKFGKESEVDKSQFEKESKVGKESEFDKSQFEKESKVGNDSEVQYDNNNNNDNNSEVQNNDIENEFTQKPIDIDKGDINVDGFFFGKFFF